MSIDLFRPSTMFFIHINLNSHMQFVHIPNHGKRLFVILYLNFSIKYALILLFSKVAPSPFISSRSTML